MAFTVEQKKKIKARAEELMSVDGMVPGAAAQKAVNELFSPEEIKGAFPVIEPPVVKEPEEQPFGETRTPEIQELDVKIEKTESQYLRERSRQLQEVDGLTEEEAQDVAAKEAAEILRKPAPLGFGGQEERREGGLIKAADELLPPYLAPQEKAIAGQEAATAVDFVELGKLFQKSFGESQEEAEADLEAFKKHLYEPKLARLKGSGVVGEEAQRQALQESLEELGSIGAKIKDKESYLKDTEATGSGDPWIRAFAKQVSAGEGVPDLTEGQRGFLNVRTSRAREGQIDERLKTDELKTVIVLQDGSQIDAIDFDPSFMKARETKKIAKTREEIEAEIEKDAPTPWWLTDKAQEIKADPEKFEKFGLFSTESPLGRTKETTAGWMLRSAMSPMNALAGFVAEAGYGLGPLKEARREARPEGYKDSPILLNIAESRGLFGEAKEAAELAGLSPENLPGLYYSTLAGGFAGDILDPSLDIMKAGGVTARAMVQNLRGTKAVYGAIDAAKGGAAVQEALKLGANDFLDNAFFGVVPGRFESGDVRFILSKNVTEEMDIAARIQEAIKNGEDPLDILTASQKKTPLGKRYAEELSSKTPDEALRAAVAGDELLSEALENSKTLDDFISKKSKGALGGRLRRKDLQRSLGSLAKLDDEVVKAARAVRGAGGKQALDVLGELTPEQLRRLKTILNYDLASKRVATATKGISGLGDQSVVALTHNTWAGKQDAKAILDSVKGSELGKVAESLADGDVKLVTTRRSAVANPTSRMPRGVDQPKKTAARVLPAYTLDGNNRKVVTETLKDLLEQGKIDGISANQIFTDIRAGKGITIENFRKLLDAQIDLTAEGLAATQGKQVTRARDLARLDVGEQRDFLSPLEARSFSRTAFRKVTEWLTGRTPANSNLSIGQIQLLNKAQTKISNLDVVLRKEMKRIVSDPEMQRLYGISEGTKLTNQEALGYLIVGPKVDELRPSSMDDISLSGTPTEERIRDTLESMVDDMFYTDTTSENVFDLFTGTKVKQNTKVFNSEAQMILDDLIEELTSDVIANPSVFWQKTKQIIDKAGALASDPSMLRFPEDEIINVIKQSKGKIPEEVQIAAYYRNEAKSVADEVMADLINTEVGKGRLAVLDGFNPEFKKAFMNQVGSALGINPAQGIAQVTSARAIQNRMKKQLSGEGAGVTAADIQEIFPNVPTATIQKALNDKGFVSVMDSYIEAANDVASGIVRRNKLENTEIGMRDAEKLISDIADKDGSIGSQLKVIFGDDVAKQLQDDLTTSFEDTRKQLVKLLHRKYSGKLGPAGTRELANLTNSLEDLRYFAILNARPRFHGANLLTGADIYYSTTGRLPDPRDIYEAVEVLRNKNPNKIIFTDASGRSYTTGELNEILETATGRSVYRTAVPSADIDRIVDLLDERPFTSKVAQRDLQANILSPKMREVLEKFKELPQSEDLLYRYAALKSALKEGRSLDDAIALSRRSMFDVTDIETSALPKNAKEFEKTLRRFALFYGFQRNSLINAIKNFTSAKGIKRIGKSKRFKDNVESLLVDEETSEYSPSYAQSRIILGKIGWKPEEGRDIIYTSPSLPSLDAVYTLAEFLKGEPQGIVGGFIRPEFKSVLGIEDQFSRELKQVPVEHVNILKTLVDNPVDPINLILTKMGAEPVVGFENKDGEFVILLNTPKQKKAYKKFMDAMSYAGVSTPITDFSRSLLPEGTKVGVPEEGIGRAAAQLGFGLGAATPMTYLSPKKQAYYDRLSRFKDLQRTTAALKSGELDRGEAASPVEEKEKDIAKRKEEIRTKRKIAPTKRIRSLKQIKQEVKTLEAKRKSREISLEQFKKRKRELILEARALTK